MRDLARNAADQAVLDFMSKAVSVGRPIATTPGVPAERVAALRNAFDDTLKDPAFIAGGEDAARRASADDGCGARGIVRDIIGAPLDAARAGEGRDPAGERQGDSRQAGRERIVPLLRDIRGAYGSVKANS